jgi:hypothetical protein
MLGILFFIAAWEMSNKNKRTLKKHVDKTIKKYNKMHPVQ